MSITGQALDLAFNPLEPRDKEGRFFHGTTDKYQPGDVIDPAKPHRANFDPEHSEPKSVYFAAKARQAMHYAERDKGGLGDPHVYEVEPTGEHWPIAPGVTQYQTKHPLRVIREVDPATEMAAATITGQALDLAPAGITAQAAGSAPDVTLARGYELNPRSGMISLDLPPGTIPAVPGGVTDFHVTVVYLGPDVDDEALAEACERAQAAATAIPGPLLGTVGGIGTFPPSGGSDGKVPAWAGVLLPGAERLRSALEDLSASEHKNWHPHVTLAYVDPSEALPPPVPATQVMFAYLSVHRGDDEVRRFPLGGGTELAGETISGQAGPASPGTGDGGAVSGQMAGTPLAERLDLAGRPKASAAS
jgi:rifampin ADP-ribosylating transferase